jgi:lipopolysaccharide export system ATP-binding protein
MRLWTDTLDKYYGRRKVVDKVSVEVTQGEIVGLLGPNGAGKTTTFYMVVGFIKPSEAMSTWTKQRLPTCPCTNAHDWASGICHRNPVSFEKLSVANNIKAVLELSHFTPAQQKDRLEMLIEEFNLHTVRNNVGDSLSGGERRRTEIARALATDPKFILLDEPFAGIDPIAVEDIQNIVAKLKTRNIGILITDHNVQETLSITDRAYLMFEGRILKAGTAEELAADEMVRKVYLGQSFILKRKVV